MLGIILIIIPLLAGLLTTLIHNDKKVKMFALSMALIQLGVTIYAGLNPYSDLCKEIKYAWIQDIGVYFSLQIDGLSFLMLLLTNLLTPLIIASAFGQKYSKTRIYYALILFMQFALNGVFLASNAFLFYVFWELALIPIFFMMLLWGGENRRRITLKFFLYTLLGSLSMLVGFLWLSTTSDQITFDWHDWMNMQITPELQPKIFILIFLAFAIKMPMFPFHTWQAETYAVSSSQTTMLLSGLMVKMAIYGMLRWLFPILPQGVEFWKDIVIVFSLIGLLYGCIIAFTQTDMKRIIAYTSMIHTAMMSIGLFTMQQIAYEGVVYQMFSHGVNIVAIFYLCQWLEDKTGTINVQKLGGIKPFAPVFTGFMLITIFSTISLPLTNGFVGEFLIMNGIAQYGITTAVLTGVSIILCAVYLLYFYQKIMLGEPAKDFVIKDMTIKESAIMFPMAAIMLITGVVPSLIINLTTEELTEIFQKLMN